MALHPLSEIFKEHKSLKWREADLKYLVQEWLRRELKTEDVLCEDVKGGVAEIRVGSAVLGQEVRVIFYQLQKEVERQSDEKLKELRVRTQY